MKNQLIEQIKAMPGIKEVQAIGDVVVVVFGEITPQKQPIYTDPDDGTEFFEGDNFWFFNKDSYKIIPDKIDEKTGFDETDVLSKIYKTRKQCELALACFIINKHEINISNPSEACTTSF